MGDQIVDVELHPGEELPLVANFEEILPTGVTVVSGVAAVYDSTGAAGPTGLLGTLSVVSPRVQQKITVGTGVVVGARYLVSIVATDSSGLDYAQRFRVAVKAITEVALSLSTHALTTLSNLKRLLLGKDTLPPAEHDDLLTFLINATAESVEQYCGSRHFERATYTNERYERVRGPMLRLNAYPILSVTAVSIDGVAVVAGTEDDEYSILAEEGMLYRASGWDGDQEPDTPERDILVSYTAGYVLPKDEIDSGLATITVVATAKTFTRSTGSFLTDGFAAGDTVVFSGFTNAGNNGSKIIDTVSAFVITVTSATGLVDESGNANERALRVRTLPYDLEDAEGQLVIARYKLRAQVGLQSESSPDGVSMSFAYWPPHVRAVLDRYKRPR